MIQKKSLKDAIQNPEIISVVGGLLPISDFEHNGLMNAGRAFFINQEDIKLDNNKYNDLNSLHVNLKQGLFFFRCNTNIPNAPSDSIGFIIHMQRSNGNDQSASQFVLQEYICTKGYYRRYLNYKTNKLEWTEWYLIGGV